MKYYIETTLKSDYTSAIEKVKAALKEEGFGVLSEIEVDKTLKEKLGVDFREYTILGACNPPLAHKALTAEDKIGTMLPCNVILQKRGENEVEVAAVDPFASMQAVQNEELRSIAETVKDKLKKVISAL